MAIFCESGDWCCPLGTAEGYYYCVKRCPPQNGQQERTILMRAKNWAAMDLVLQQKNSSSFPAFCVPNNTGNSSSTSAAQFSNNTGTSWIEENGVEYLATFPLSIRFFQFATICERQKCFYTIGKENDEEWLAAEKQKRIVEMKSGTFRCYRKSLGTKEFLFVVKINYMPPFSYQIFKSIRSFYSSLCYGPRLYCEPTDGKLYLFLNYKARSKGVQSSHNFHKHSADFGNNSPFTPVDFPARGEGMYVNATCIFRLDLEENVDNANKLELVNVPIPHPPIKATRIVHLDKKSKPVLLEDNLTIFPYHWQENLKSNSKNDGASRHLNLFTLNTNGRADIYLDGDNKWHQCTMENEETLKFMMQHTTFTFDRHKLIGCNGRIFLCLLKSAAKDNDNKLEGPLFEIQICNIQKTYRLKQICQQIILPKEINPICSAFNHSNQTLLSSSRFIAFSQFYQWRKIDDDNNDFEKLNEIVPDYTIQVISTLEPHPLKQISFWALQEHKLRVSTAKTEEIAGAGSITRSRKRKIDNAKKLEEPMRSMVEHKQIMNAHYINEFLNSFEMDK